jgi:hypothetical protein
MQRVALLAWIGFALGSCHTLIGHRPVPADSARPPSDLDTGARDQPDLRLSNDGGARDARPDARKPDTRPPDTRPPDTRPPDTRPPDAKKPDAKKPDTRPPDAKKPDAKKPDSFVASPCELTEGNASAWSAGCNLASSDLSNVHSCASCCGLCTASVVNDSKQGSSYPSGTQTIKFVCNDCGSDSYARVTHPAAGWNLTGMSTLSFHIRTNTDSASGWQDDVCGKNPWILLRDASNKRRLIERMGATPDPNTSRTQWIKVEANLSSPGAIWNVLNLDGSFSLSTVKSIEIHMDPWGAGFTAWIDGLTFFAGGTQFTGCTP